MCVEGGGGEGRGGEVAIMIIMFCYEKETYIYMKLNSQLFLMQSYTDKEKGREEGRKEGRKKEKKEGGEEKNNRRSTHGMVEDKTQDLRYRGKQRRVRKESPAEGRRNEGEKKGRIKRGKRSKL